MPTPNHAYETPDRGQLDWDVPLNGNFRGLDTDVEIRDIAGNITTSNYSPADGAKALATDTGAVYLGDGSNWNRIGTVADFDPSTIASTDLGFDPATQSELDTAVSDLDLQVATPTAAYTASNRDIVLADASAGAFTVTLPTPASAVNLVVKKIDATNNVTIATPGTETIDGMADLTLTTQYQSRRLASDGSNYFVI